MSAPSTARRAIRAGLGLLVFVIFLAGGFLFLEALPGFIDPAGDAGATLSPIRSPEPTSPMAGGPINVKISPNADCDACHVEANGSVGTRPIPTLAHPLEGWTDCTACHADDRLVKSAPGHTGLHKADCLVCHKVSAQGSAAPARPHHVVAGTACVSCHGTKAPLPTDMAGRTNCWLCHSGTEFNDLFGSPAPTISPVPWSRTGG